MREMGYQVARRHAEKLRRLATVLLFVLPIAATVAQFMPLTGAGRLAIALLAVASAGAGVLIERWLFFAEAVHVVVLYYRGGAA
jgi:DMSO reductase anchor subunit